MGDGTVTLYTGPESARLDQARRFLKNRRIPFEEKDIMHDAGARGELRAKTGSTGYPALDVGGRVMIGFQHTKWEDLLRGRS